MKWNLCWFGCSRFKKKQLITIMEYLYWNSLRHKKTDYTLIKQEPQNKIEVFDGDMICRVCTMAADIPVTSRIDGTIIIMNAIRTVANISINEADHYPKYVCKGCLDELKIAFQFKKKCETSDMMFRKSISSETFITTSSQPMVMHDFQLLLHQMKQEREALQNATFKLNDALDDDRDIVSSPTSLNTEDTENDTRKTAITTAKKKKPLKCEKNVQRRILKLLKTKEKKLRELKCNRCNKKFKNKEEMIKHKNQNSCSYQPCPLCGKLVLNLPQHKNIVHLRPNKYTCHQCGKIYYSSGSLTNHMQVHRETFEYSCDLCPYKAKRKSYLVCHMRVHTGEHRYLCAKCPSKFTNPSNLRKHQLIHIGKKFECSKCKKLFRLQKTMQEHFDSAHLNIRYRCSICGRDLSSRKKLLSHELRVHKREKHKLFQELQKVVISNENE